MDGLLYINVDLLKNKELFHKGISLISESRKEKIRTLKNPDARNLSLGAGILLHIAMNRCGIGDQADNIKYEGYGKPYIENSEFHFNLSHSGTYAVCAYSNMPIGIDIQMIKEQFPKHTNKILSSSEKEYLETVSDKEKKEQFYSLWAKKESLIKWDGRGLRLPLDKLSFTAAGKCISEFTFDNCSLYFYEYRFLYPKYAICLCTEKDSFTEEFIEITSEFLLKY